MKEMVPFGSTNLIKYSLTIPLLIMMLIPVFLSGFFVDLGVFNV